MRKYPESAREHRDETGGLMAVWDDGDGGGLAVYHDGYVRLFRFDLIAARRVVARCRNLPPAHVAVAQSAAGIGLPILTKDQVDFILRLAQELGL